jgi:hypothetical protein
MAGGTISPEPVLVYILMALIARIGCHSKFILEEGRRRAVQFMAPGTIGLLVRSLKRKGGLIMVKTL